MGLTQCSYTSLLKTSRHSPPPRTEHRAYVRHVYKDRTLMERFFYRLKPCRLATRYENLARNFVSLLNLVCSYIWLA